MDVLKAAPLESPNAVLHRFLFRILWCSVGVAVGLALFANLREQIWFLACAVLAVSSIGALMDSYRLRHPRANVQLLRVMGGVLIGFGLVAYFSIRSAVVG
jgi:threonine/homoserine/homoserine lactone efflux protein